MSDQPASLAAALVQLQGRLPRITKDATGQVGTRTYPYATLASIMDLITPLLLELGLLWVCLPTMFDGQFVLEYRLTHIATGEGLDGRYPLPSSTPQTMGGAITYARRYAICALLGITPVEDDDDAQGAEREAREGAEWRPPANPRTRKADRHRADRNGPLPDDDWTTGPPEDAPGSITKAQSTRIHMGFTKLGITDRDDRLAYVMSKLDLPELGSSKDLTMAQASDLIKHLDREAGD